VAGLLRERLKDIANADSCLESEPFSFRFPENRDRSIWVIAETFQGGLRRVTLEMLGKARQLTAVTKSEVAAVLLGTLSDKLHKELAARGADRVMVLRDGKHVATRDIDEVTRDQLIEMMVGRKLENEFPERKVAIGAERLVVRGLSRGARVREVSFSVRAGEVVGLTGLVGSGRTETARLLFGADTPDSGSIVLDGKPLRLSNPRDAIREGICLLTEDRKSEGLVLKQTSRENFSLPNVRRFSRFGMMRSRQERTSFERYVKDLRIKLSHLEQVTETLSGGNQQKVVLAKWIQADSEVIIFDEPTRGIDVGAKYEIYVLIGKLASEGKAILMISSELPEILGMSDRIFVMRDGHIAGEFDSVSQVTQEDILRLAVGGDASSDKQ